jgi:hypothetical protein
MPIAFLEVASLFRKIETLSRQKAKAPQKSTQTTVRETIFEWFEKHRGKIAYNAKTLIAILSALLPDLRPDRVYSLREDGLAKVLTKALHISGTRRETELIDYRTSTKEGDLGSAVQKVVSQAETSKGGFVTVDELDEVLDKLAARCVFTSKELREMWKGESAEASELLKPLFFRLSSFEAKWVTRCILKSLAPAMMPGVEYPYLQVRIVDTDGINRNHNSSSIPLPTTQNAISSGQPHESVRTDLRRGSSQSLPHCAARSKTLP